MANCLITQLSEAVTDVTLPKLGEIWLKVVDVANGRNDISGNADLRIEGNGYFTDSTGTQNLGKTSTAASRGATGSAAYLSPGQYNLVIENKYGVTWLRFNSNTRIIFIADELAYMNNLFSIEASFAAVEGDLNKIPMNVMTYFAVNNEKKGKNAVHLDLSHLAEAPTGINYICLTNTDTKGNISEISGKTGLVKLSLDYTNVEGNISSIAGLTNIENLSFTGDANITGNISSLSGMTKLKTCGLGGTGVTGSLSVFAGFSDIESFNISSTAIAGDLSVLANLTKLSTVWYGNCPNITGTWPLS